MYTYISLIIIDNTINNMNNDNNNHNNMNNMLKKKIKRKDEARACLS